MQNKEQKILFIIIFLGLTFVSSVLYYRYITLEDFKYHLPENETLPDREDSFEPEAL